MHIAYILTHSIKEDEKQLCSTRVVYICLLLIAQFCKVTIAARCCLLKQLLLLLILTFTSHTYRTIDLLGNKSNMEAYVIMHSMSTWFSNISIVQWIWFLWQLERLWSKIWSLYFKFALCLAHPPYYRPLLAIMSPSWSLWAIIAYYRHSLNMDQFLFLAPSYWWEKCQKMYPPTLINAAFIKNSNSSVWPFHAKATETFWQREMIFKVKTAQSFY